MRTTTVYGTAMVVLATAVNLLHGVSHVGQEVLSLQPKSINRTFSLAWELKRMAGLLLKSFRRLVSRKEDRP